MYEKPTARPGWQDALEAFDPLAAARAARASERAAGAARLAGHRLQGVGVPPVRPAGRDQHAGAAGLGRRRAAHQGHPARRVAVTTDCNARFVYPRPARGRGDGGGRGRAQPVGERRAAARPHRLPELRLAGAARRSCGSSRRRWRGSPRPAARSTSRWSAATSPSTMRPSGRPSCRRRSSAWRAARRGRRALHPVVRGGGGPGRAARPGAR